VAREVAGDRWPEVAYASGLVQYVEQDPPHDDQLSSPVESLSRLNEAFETIYGPEAEDQIRAWARRATERWLAEGKHGLGGTRRFMQGRQRKLLGIVKSFTESMDNVRGEHTHQDCEVLLHVDLDHRDDPAVGRPGQRLVRGRGGVWVRDGDVRLRIRDPFGRHLGLMSAA
jgi:hypothetical protein